jgi:hypothetical protein
MTLNSATHKLKEPYSKVTAIRLRHDVHIQEDVANQVKYRQRQEDIK